MDKQTITYYQEIYLVYQYLHYYAIPSVSSQVFLFASICPHFFHVFFFRVTSFSNKARTVVPGDGPSFVSRPSGSKELGMSETSPDACELTAQDRS